MISKPALTTAIACEGPTFDLGSNPILGVITTG
jgi:hypothetical protein